MAASHLKLSSFIAFLCIVLLVSSPTEKVEAGLCGRLSGTFSGLCIDDVNCDDVCHNEGAVSGSCQADHLRFSVCCCYYNCEK